MATLKSIDINGTLLLDFIYPVGSIYTTTNDSFDPAARFGGTWKKLSGVFLYANESGMSSKSTGGEKTHTLTTAEMPKHGHSLQSNINYADRAALTGSNWELSPVKRGSVTYTGDTGGGCAQQYATLLLLLNVGENCLKRLKTFFHHLKKGGKTKWQLLNLL